MNESELGEMMDEIVTEAGFQSMVSYSAFDSQIPS